jgi:predicted nuclease of predicted toxin-antitoxin system
VRLLLDEHFSPAIARQLRERGHDVVAVKEQLDLVARADRLQFAVAANQRRAIVTQDIADFRPLFAQAMRAGSKTYGLVCVPASFPLSRAAIGSVVRALHELLVGYPGDEKLAELGGEVWLSSGE